MKRRNDIPIIMTEEISRFLKEVEALYRRVQTTGFLIIVGGGCALFLVVLSITPCINPPKHEFITIAILAGFFVFLGCLLFMFISYMQFKLSQDLFKKEKKIKIDTEITD